MKELNKEIFPWFRACWHVLIKVDNFEVIQGGLVLRTMLVRKPVVIIVSKRNVFSTHENS